jgi:hypothetical protein
MKIRKTLRIFGTVLILSLLLALIPVLPSFATATIYTYGITVTPTHGTIGDAVMLHGVCSPAPVTYMGVNIYFSPSNLDVGDNVTSASSYMRVVSGISILTTDMDPTNAGNFTAPFTVPNTLPIASDPVAGGTVAFDIEAGIYYVYATIPASTNSTMIVAKTSYTVAIPTLDALSPASGPTGTSVVVSGNYFPASVPLVFKIDTMTLIPQSGDTSVRTTGSFTSYITIPSSISIGPHTIYVTAGTGASAITLPATFTVNTGLPSSPAVIAISPGTGVAGITVTITGSYFTAGVALHFYFSTSLIVPTSGATAADTNGMFTAYITVPPDATAGSHVITVLGGNSSPTATFIVTGLPPTQLPSASFTIDPNAGSVNSTTITCAGSNFIAMHDITISFNGTTVKVTNANESGLFSTSFQVPVQMHGVHAITATDGTHTVTKTFTVESTPPGTPQPQRPLMNEAISFPFSFDWDAVTDLSTPVTYNLQIATSANFTTDTLIINKTGIATHTYALTDADQLKLTTGVTYYWREKAVDAAYNESEWTGANIFTLSKGFEFTGWLLYATIAIVAVLLFLLGIWIGRKSAFSY